MFSYWAYVLIGNNNTGKTSFQRHLLDELCGQSYQRLPRNHLANIIHPRMPRGVETLFQMNRSYQEKIHEYIDMDNYFSNFFKNGDICIMSSHSHGSKADVLAMTRHLRLNAYNVAAVFFSNGYDDDCAEISLYDWDERLWVDNPQIENEEAIKEQLHRRAREFSQFLIARAMSQ